jgi:hypothetical protein|uniref:Uncharacterized protein n=1 Tax=viral metagenome TaxID=1070528 RepID=A0A6C0IQA0_9ZZZZ
MQKHSLRKRDNHEQYRNLLDVMKNQIRSLDAMNCNQRNEINRLEQKVEDLNQFVRLHIHANNEYIDANYLQSNRQSVYDNDDNSVFSQDSNSSLNSSNCKMRVNGSGGTVKKIYIQRDS